MQKKSLCADDLLKETIEQYSPFVYRLAYSLVKSRSDADDIHQEVFIAYIKKRPGFESEEHERAWFIRVTVNFCKNLQKSAWKRKIVSLTEFGDDWEAEEKEEQDWRMLEESGEKGEQDSWIPVGTGNGMQKSIPGTGKACRTVAVNEEAQALLHTVKRLPQKYRSVIHLFYYEEMSVEEIALALNRKPSTVRTQLTRARRKLSEMLKEEI